jgi:hypothetical protein
MRSTRLATVGKSASSITVAPASVRVSCVGETATVAVAFAPV